MGVTLGEQRTEGEGGGGRGRGRGRMVGKGCSTWGYFWHIVKNDCSIGDSADSTCIFESMCVVSFGGGPGGGGKWRRKWRRKEEMEEMEEK